MSCQTYERHPLNIIPEHSPEERREILSSIEKDKLSHPIVLFEGMVLDGMGRQTCCLELEAKGLDVNRRYRQWQPNPNDKRPAYVQAAIFVIIEAFKRRQLPSATERAMLTMRLMDQAAAMATRGRPPKPSENPEEKNVTKVTQGEMADASGTSRKTMNEVMVATKKCISEIKDLMGKRFAAGDASNVADLKPAEQKKILDLAQKEKCSLTAAMRELHARNKSLPGASVKTKRYWVEMLVAIDAESDALAVDMIERRNSDERMPPPVMQGVGLSVGGIKSFVRCVRCTQLIYETTPRKKNDNGTIQCRECPDGKKE